MGRLRAQRVPGNSYGNKDTVRAANQGIRCERTLATKVKTANGMAKKTEEDKSKLCWRAAPGTRSKRELHPRGSWRELPDSGTYPEAAIPAFVAAVTRTAAFADASGATRRVAFLGR